MEKQEKIIQPKQQHEVIFQDQYKKVLLIKKKDQRMVCKITTNEDSIYQKYARRQAKLMKQIIHPNVVKLIKYEQMQNTIKIYMLYYENKDLSDFLLKNKLDFKTKISMFIDILCGLKELHSRFIIHRDLKLQNIFVDREGHCVIGDLGISTKSVDKASSFVRTFACSAPQVISCQKRLSYNDKVDLWGLGIIAYQLFNQLRNNSIPFPFSKLLKFLESGEQYISIDRYKQITNQIAPFDQNLPQEIINMITKMLDNNEYTRIDWLQLYQKKYLNAFDSEGRLQNFVKDYEQIYERKSLYRAEILQIAKFKQQFYYQLKYILSVQRRTYFLQKYQGFKKQIKHFYIFYYLSLKKYTETYKKIINLSYSSTILDLKKFYKQISNQLYSLELAVNNLLKCDGESLLEQSKNYSSDEYFHSKRKVIIEILDQIDRQDLKECRK